MAGAPFVHDSDHPKNFYTLRPIALCFKKEDAIASLIA